MSARCPACKGELFDDPEGSHVVFDRVTRCRRCGYFAGYEGRKLIVESGIHGVETETFA